MKKNIWILNHYATNMYINKGGRHYWFAENLIKHGYNPTIFCASTLHNSDDIIKTYGKKYSVNKSNDIPFVFVKSSGYTGNGKDRIKNMLSFYKNLLSVSKNYVKYFGKPDVILASSVHPLTLIAGIKIAKKLEVPCICEIRDLWPEAIFAFDKIKESSNIGKVLMKGEYWIYKNADSLIFTKEGDSDYIKEKRWDTKQGGEINLDKCHYINNGVDLDKFDQQIIENTVADRDLVDKKFNVTYVGSIRPVNNVGNILDTASLLQKETDIQFLIYGDGNERKLLEERIVNENLKNVKIKGYISKKFIPYILSNSSVNILNYSQHQYNWSRGNSSNKLFEYMASRKPIISTVKMGYSIIEKYNCGVELEDSSPKELADNIIKIKRLSEKKYNIFGENARRGAQDFDFKKLTSDLVKVIKSV